MFKNQTKVNDVRVGNIKRKAAFVEYREERHLEKEKKEDTGCCIYFNFNTDYTEYYLSKLKQSFL